MPQLPDLGRWWQRANQIIRDMEADKTEPLESSIPDAAKKFVKDCEKWTCGRWSVRHCARRRNPPATKGVRSPLRNLLKIGHWKLRFEVVTNLKLKTLGWTVSGTGHCKSSAFFGHKTRLTAIALTWRGTQCCPRYSTNSSGNCFLSDSVFGRSQTLMYGSSGW
jgi:hypothetical protein